MPVVWGNYTGQTPKVALSSSKDGSVEVGVHDFDKTLEYLSNDDNS